MGLKALDLFCGAGGASMGLHKAGFDVIGVDIKQQPNYPFVFVQADALNPPFDLDRFDLIWASPPCQKWTAYARRPDHVANYPDLIDATRSLLRDSHYIIENIAGAELQNPVLLCGSMFGLDVQRHRIFETSFSVDWLFCRHRTKPQFAPASNRKSLRTTAEIGVWRIPLEVQREAMGIDWMVRHELSEAVPPSYAEYLGRQFVEKVH